MTTRTGLLVTTAVGGLMIGMGSGSPALAADQLVTKARPVVETGWWQSYYVEVGGRFFLQRHGGPTGGNFVFTNPEPFPSLGKFYEYRDLRQGPFGEISFAGGSRDGLYQYGLLAKNIGYHDQSYSLDWSQAGVQYLTLGFDQTPHIYNNNATTLFRGTDTDTLTVNPAVRAALNGFLGPTNAVTGSNSPTAAGRAGIANTIENGLGGFTLGFQRYSGTAAYRWTPKDDTDVTLDYNITRRDGTQPMGSLSYNGVERGGRIVLELPRPIHDETHNANANVEYIGVTPWGKKFNVMASYGISAFRNDSDFFTYQNPFNTVDGPFTPANNLMSLPPSNMANIFRLNGGLDLPWKSRWVGAVVYTRGQQNEGFLPFTINPTVAPLPVLTVSPDFHSNNLLVNNVLTTKWTTELAQTSRYRFYDYDAGQNRGTLSFLLLADSANGTDPDDAFLRRGVSYTKQNAGTDFVWHPMAHRWLTLGAGVGWEQWDRRWRGHDTGDADVRITNEFMGKVFVNAKPWDWSQLRATYIHAERRFDGTYQQNIGGNDEACEGGASCTGFRAYDLADRNRDKLNVMLDLYAQNGVVITPTAGFRIDDYSDGIVRDMFGGGLLHDNSWNAGVDVAWTINPNITLTGSYMREDARKKLWIPFTTHTPLPGAINELPFPSFVADEIDTFMAGANVVVIPDKFDIKVAYTLMQAKASISTPPVNPVASFPDQTQTLNRVDVQSKYKVDPGFMQQFGFKGETYVKLRYLWEHNQVTDWAAVNWNYMYLFNTDTSQNKNIQLGYNNPNYNVQLLMASLSFKW
jgi:MtrB/PioB family decaheme-associated outer membrane protein